MNIWVEAREMYEKHGLDFDQDYSYYQLHGYILQGPDFILMGEEEDDGWFIAFAIGKGCVPLFLRLMPFEKPYIYLYRFQRGQKKRVKIPIKRLQKLYST
jgi:hypothetical protein